MIQTKIQGKIYKKPYSIATTNKMLQEEKLLWIVVKKASDTGMSARLTQNITVWDTIHITWPVWHYTDSKRHKKYLLISVWSGLSPNLGLFQHLVYEQTDQTTSIINVFWERYAKHIVPHIHDMWYGHGKKNVQTMYCFSQESNIPSWLTTSYTKTTSWYVQSYIPHALEQLGTNISCFLCGKPNMVEDVRAILTQAGVGKEDITFEKY